MARLTTGFEYQPIIAPYAPAPVQEFRDSLIERSNVFDKNVAEMDRLDILANNIDVLDPDKEIKLAEINKVRNALKDVSQFGAENATNLVRAVARDFASNQNLKGASEKYTLEKQRQEDLKQLRLKGLTPYDFTPEYRGYVVDPNWTPSVEGANDVLSDAKRYVGTIKDKFRDLGWNLIERTDANGIKYTVAVTGDGQEVTDKMIDERVGSVIDEFVKSPSGGNQYVRWNEFNGRDGRQAAIDILKTAALEQKGGKFEKKYQVLVTDTSGAGNNSVPPPETGQRGLVSSNSQRFDENFDMKEVSGFDDFLERLKASNMKFDTENPIIDPQTGIPMYGIVPGKKISNEYSRERLEPYAKKALSYLYPQMSSSEINSLVESSFKKGQFILDQPEIKEGLQRYYESVKDLQTNPWIIDPNIGATTTREADKNFTAENIEKEIKRNFLQRRYKTTIDGKVVDVTDDVIKILNSDINTFGVAGIYDIMNHFIEPDPDSQVQGRDPSGQMFAQPYALNLRVPDDAKDLKVLEAGKPFEIAASREFGHVVGRDGDKDVLQTSAIIYNQAVRNYGTFTEVDPSSVPYISESIGNVPFKVRVMKDDSGKNTFEIESDVVLRAGGKQEKLYIRTNPSERPEEALYKFMNTIVEERRRISGR